VLLPKQVADLIVWLAASPPEFVLTEGIVVPIEEGSAVAPSVTQVLICCSLRIVFRTSICRVTP
jgi:hypothetical protein